AAALRGQPGAVVFLEGDLGAGKTTLARGLLQAMGVQGRVRSPTYTLMEPYQAGGRTILHMDLYRLADPLELHNLGLADYPPAETLWLVEWPEKGGALLPSPELRVTLQLQGGGRRADLHCEDPLRRALAAEFSEFLKVEH
ncbi:MAG TPA: tRNA (adenosine(37)-N6)-threonylcarbamoyltransferase complex ATPase subunit type 1 TsaE, partial [Solimonas sp.]|nr:tRNA (adenosine(37)-N6)-threonylcarbamoyltransferase complex ATPase subunit type 1 TsaE [Solimonas sp.]